MGMVPLICVGLLLVLSGARGACVAEDEDVQFSGFTDEQMETVNELVEIHAPFLRFHKTEGEDEFCFPENATEYYNQRVAEDWSRRCNMDYSTIHNGLVPTYWHAMPCEEDLHIAYWSFTGFNHVCDGVSGSRDGWWEFLVVKVRRWETTPIMAEIMFGQKKGWYTRVPGRYEIIDDTHPVAYVGRASHGFYHDAGGTSTCCYFEDTRNPGSPDQYMRTHLNLVELKHDNTGEDWMMDPSTHYWSGILSPTYRDNWNLCKMLGCTGSHLQVCGTCGCHKSDIGEDPF